MESKDLAQKKLFLMNELQNLYNSKQFKEAESKAKELIKKFPKSASIYNFLGLIFKQQKEIKKAVKSFEKAISIDPTFPDSYNNLGNLYTKVNKFKKSIQNFNIAIKINQKLFMVHYNLGLSYKALGDFNNAKKCFLKSINIRRHFFYAYRQLGMIKKWKKEDKTLIELIKIFAGLKNDNDLKKELAFTLGKAHEDILDYKKSFKYFEEANRIQNNDSNYSIEYDKNLFKKIKSTYTKNLFINNKDKFDKKNKCTPIFIVGMPRSGSTLIEQILSNHSKIYSCGEIEILNDLINKLYFNDKKDFLSEDTFVSNMTILKEIKNKYLKNLEMISNKSQYVTDKMLLNFKWLGIIKLIIPNAKIIHCIRDPRDNCISIFKNFFPARGMEFSSSLENIVEYYLLYRDLMQYWHKTFPGFVLDLNYEELIDCPDITVKNIFKYLELKWEKNCMNFYKSKRPVQTASDVQIRKPMYKSSISSWLNYEPYLNNIFKKLYE